MRGEKESADPDGQYSIRSTEYTGRISVSQISQVRSSLQT